MAKVGLNKLGLVKNTKQVDYMWNGQKIEILQYLPVEKKLEIIGYIINESVDLKGYYAPYRLDLFMTIAVVQNYTNITFTEKQKDDLGKLYDLLVSSGLYEEIKNRIPKSEIEYIQENITKTIHSIYEYKNSVLGIIEAINNDYKNITFNAEKIQSILESGEGLETVREVLDNLG